MKLKVLLLALIAAMSVVSCGSSAPDEIDISGYADETVTFSGIGDGDVAISISELKDMDCVTYKTNSTSDKIGDVRATGVLMDTVLAPYGAKQEDFEKIVITGEDGYDIKLKNKYLKEHPIMLAFGIDGMPLDEESAPCRIIIKKSDSAYWVRRVTSIEFVK